MSRKPNVAIVTHPYLVRSGKTPLDNMIALISPLANKLILITGGEYDNPSNEIEIVRVKATLRRSFIFRVAERIVVDARMLSILLKLRRDIDVLIFFLGTTFPVPLIFARALHMKCFIVLANIGSKTSGAWRFGDLVRIHLSEAMQRVSFYFVHKLIVYSPSIVDQVKLHRYDKKIVVAHRHFLDFDVYRFKDDIEQRAVVIGYIGRLSEEKGIWNFVKAIPLVLNIRNDVTFLIIGEGRLEDEVRAYLSAHALESKVTLTGWIRHRELPAYLTSLKLLVLPSYDEGLPNVMLEAMACGTPFLATPVGSIPDIVRDGKTGFLLRENSSICLAESIIEVLDGRNLQQIVTDARTFVESEFRYESVVARWKDLIWEERQMINQKTPDDCLL